MANKIKYIQTEERILKVIDRKSIEEVTFNDVAVLIGLGTAIKDGETTVEEAFPLNFDAAQKKTQQDIKAETGSEAVNEIGQQQGETNDGQPAFLPF